MRLLFAHQLRALAVACVVVSHYAGVYWNARDEVASAIMARPPTAPSPALTRWLDLAWFNPGPFGVAVFFLVSGFVIPFSLQRLPPGRFLVARAWRIFPTYWVGLAVGLLALRMMAEWSGQPFALSPARAAANALLVNEHLGLRSIDLVNWTLSTEIEFYLVMASVSRWAARTGVLAAAGVGCAGLAAGALGLAGLFGNAAIAGEARSLYHLTFVPYMLVGTLFWLRWQGRSSAPLVAAGLALGGAFAAGLVYGPLRALSGVVLIAYAEALVVFTVAYACRGLARPVRWLDALASISYPLYAVHALVGYCVLTWSLAAGAPPLAAMAAAAAVALGLATAMHVTVERWSIRRGHAARAPIRRAVATEAAPRP